MITLSEIRPGMTINKSPEITQEFVKELFEYRDGVLYWKVKRGNMSVGSFAGTLCRDRKGDRIKVMINNKQLKRSRIVFLYHKGWLPEIVDHEDRNTLNDKIENLRAANRSQNNMNTVSKPNSSSIYKGVTKAPTGSKWISGIKKDGKRMHLGSFSTEEDAALRYNKEAVKLFGEFANLNIIETKPQ